MSRRLLVYLLLDTSGSMKGAPAESIKVGIDSMVSSLKTNPHALDMLHLSIITFDREVNETLPMTKLEGLVLPEIKAIEINLSNLGMALEFLYQKCDQELVRSTEAKRGDWKPLLFLLSTKEPSDLSKYREIIPKVKSLGFRHIVGCSAGQKANPEYIKLLTKKVVQLGNSDSHSFRQFFKWVSEIICKTLFPSESIWPYSAKI
jgi:uncharacterized protein YegL